MDRRHPGHDGRLVGDGHHAAAAAGALVWALVPVAVNEREVTEWLLELRHDLHLLLDTGFRGKALATTLAESASPCGPPTKAERASCADE